MQSSTFLLRAYCHDRLIVLIDIRCGFCILQISHRCETHELQRFPQLRRRIEEVVASFLREGLSPAETMIGHLIEMEVGKSYCG